jgi:hypothetical protein
MGWEQSNANKFIYYKGKVIFLVYADDGISISPDDDKIDNALKSLQTTFKISVKVR